MATGTIALDDTGWITATLGADFDIYSSDVPPKYRRIGNIVNVTGHVKPKLNLLINNAATYTILTMPDGFRPIQQTTVLCQGSGKYIWDCSVLTDGQITLSRYRTGANYANCTTSTWLPFNIVYSAG